MSEELIYGVVRQKNNLYAVRILTNFGYLDPDKLIKICEISKKYTKSDISFTSRGTIEIIGLEKTDLKNICEDLKNEGINIGGTDKALRFIQTCKGRECQFGVINPNKIAEILEENIKIEKLENKFKIGVFGCNNSLGKARSNDLGIIPFVDNNNVKFKIFLGGRMGKEAILGYQLSKVINLNEILDIVKKTIEFYKINATNSERFSGTLKRIGVKEFENFLFEDYMN